MKLNLNEVKTLQELAKKYMHYASLSVHSEKMKLWKALNSGKMERPLVIISQLPWNELNINDELTCIVKDEYFRKIEWQLRSLIYKWEHCPADMVLEPYVSIPKVVNNSGYGLAVSEVTLENEMKNVASHKYNNQLKTIDDILKIKDMNITYDATLTMSCFEYAKNIFHGIAPVKLQGGVSINLGIWDQLSEWMGIEDIYYDIVDRPEFIHEILNRITDATLAGIKQANDLCVYNDNENTCHCSYIYTDELLPDFGAGKGSISNNCWSFGMAQLFTSVSPSVTEEFELPYITKLAKHFGMIYYGCCDRLDDRLDIVKRIPNVKKVSCSPWSDKTRFAHNIGTELIMSYKPNPAFLAAPTFDEETVRLDLTETCILAKENNVNLEIILKDISTVLLSPKRLTKWGEIATDVINNIYG